MWIFHRIRVMDPIWPSIRSNRGTGSMSRRVTDHSTSPGTTPCIITWFTHPNRRNLRGCDRWRTSRNRISPCESRREQHRISDHIDIFDLHIHSTIIPGQFPNNTTISLPEDEPKLRPCPFPGESILSYPQEKSSRQHEKSIRCNQSLE
jgi:hypothetical protein